MPLVAPSIHWRFVPVDYTLDDCAAGIRRSDGQIPIRINILGQDFVHLLRFGAGLEDSSARLQDYRCGLLNDSGLLAARGAEQEEREY